MHESEQDIISGLPKSMRTQVVLHLYKEALEKVPIFKGQNSAFITAVVTHLKLEYYSPGRYGEVTHVHYYLLR